MVYTFHLHLLRTLLLTLLLGLVGSRTSASVRQEVTGAPAGGYHFIHYVYGHGLVARVAGEGAAAYYHKGVNPRFSW